LLRGKKIVTPQTSPEGLIANSLLVSPPIDIHNEAYLGLTINRERAQIVLIASPVGGMDIEKVAHEQPEKLLVLPLPAEGAFRTYHYIYLAHFMGWDKNQAEQGIAIVKALTKAFKETDAVLLEINPLVTTDDSKISCSGCQTCCR